MSNVAKEKSLAFSVRIVRLYRHLCTEKQEFVMSKQLLRCGTSIGANLAEAECAMSRNDFAAKVYIALKECSETCYWLELLFRTDYLSREAYDSLLRDCRELRAILTKTTYTLSK